MEGRIEPVLPRFGIQSIGGDVRDRRGRQGAFEETLEKQKEGRKGKTDKSLEANGEAQDGPKNPGRTRSEPTEPTTRRGANDGEAHVDILV